ncbi:hypothetical protein [Candidatus Poriferisocius sp.]|uniref:hypothetical protein n=1 Tax=Candidatus Poriferisocius sp. TaxID=3101276 RepID=UPI003B025022
MNKHTRTSDILMLATFMVLGIASTIATGAFFTILGIGALVELFNDVPISSEDSEGLGYFILGAAVSAAASVMWFTLAGTVWRDIKHQQELESRQSETDN